jgi:CO/xanthine dehydrogenase Mo-binding subunit
LPDAAHIVYVRSPRAHARIRGIETSQAAAAGGVLAVLTAADVDISPAPPGLGGHPAMARPWLARDTVRFAGEAVAIVVAETRTQAVDAAELVQVDYDPLPAVVDPEAALDDATLLFPEAGTNLVDEFTVGDVDDALARCEVVVEQRIVNQRVSASPLETRGAAASWSDGHHIKHWAHGGATDLDNLVLC